MTLAAKQAKMSYRVTNLEYEAVAISAGNALGIYVSAGEAYSFGRSVEGGVNQLEYYLRTRSSCANTYWVLTGYSQGAMVVANTLKSFDVDKVVYVAMLGDPKLYLPEGEGFYPLACRGENLSRYRVYVPNCDTDNGILGARKPYELEDFAGRYGLWCNDNDFICGSSKNPLNNKGHSLYEENGVYYTLAMQVLKRLNYLRKYHLLLGDERSVKSRSEEIPSEEKLGTVLAQLSQYQYYAEVGEAVVFDASGSFSVDGDTLDYAWYLDGKELAESSECLKLSFDKNDYHAIEVEVRDKYGDTSRAKAMLVVGRTFVDEPAIPSPNINARRCGEKRICLSWTRTRGSGQFLALRINDYFMGFADIANEELVIDDVNFSDIRIAMGNVDAGYNVGEMSELKIEGITESVPTSASLPWWRILAIMLLPICILGLVRAILRLVLDITRMK